MGSKIDTETHLKRGFSDTLIAALDIGTSKVSCFIAKLKPSGEISVIGVGQHASAGMKSGTIIDLKAVESAIGHAVSAAERIAAPHMNGQALQSVYVNVPGNHIISHQMSVDVKVSGHEITDKDIKGALMQAKTVEVPGQDELIHTIAADYSIDGHHGVREPRGMYGQTLGVSTHAVTARSPALRNISNAIGQNHLDIEGFCAAPYASGLSCLVEDEKNLGCTVIDMGGGTTSMAVFIEGKMIFSSAIPVGGVHVTNDIARGLITSITDAERIKTLYGSTAASSSDDNDMIDVPPIGEEDHSTPNHIPRSLLVGIIQPRIEETFELIRAKLEDNGLYQMAGRRVVLTGGASQLNGLPELGQMILDKKIRLGQPLHIKGLADATSGPAFSTITGLLHYAAEHADEHPTHTANFLLPTILPTILPGTLVQRVSGWLKENW